MATPSPGFIPQTVVPALMGLAKNSLSIGSAPSGPSRSSSTPMGSPLPFALSKNQNKMISDDITRVQTQMHKDQPLPTPRKDPLPPPANIFPGQANPVPLQFKGDDPKTTKVTDKYGKTISLTQQADRDEIASAEAARQKPADDPNAFKVVDKNAKLPPPAQIGTLLGTSGLRVNGGKWAELNPGTTSCSNSRVVPTDLLGGGVAFAQRPNENILRRLTTNAMTEMNKAPIPATWLLSNKPAVMGILVGRGTQNAPEGPRAEAPTPGSAESPEMSRDSRTGWQIYLHSSAKGYPRRGNQAKLHPALAKSLGQLAYHHYSGMCAEMGLLTNYLSDNPTALATGKFPPESVYMMTYTATDFLDGPGVGKFLAPCNHKNCLKNSLKNHDLNPAHHGCEQVFQALGINYIGKGDPSETYESVMEEEAQRMASMRSRTGEGGQAGTDTGLNPPRANHAQPNQSTNPSSTPNPANTVRRPPPPTTPNPPRAGQTPTATPNPTNNPRMTPAASNAVPNPPRTPSQSTATTTPSYASATRPPPPPAAAAAAAGNLRPRPPPQGNKPPAGGKVLK